MYDFGRAHNFWVDIPVPQGDVFRQLSILNVQDSVLLTCIGALMNKSWNIFQQPTILDIFDMTGLTWLMRTCRNLPKEVLNIGTCARNGGEDLRNFWSWHTFFCHAFPQLFKSVFFDWKKVLCKERISRMMTFRQSSGGKVLCVGSLPSAWKKLSCLEAEMPTVRKARGLCT